MKVGGITMTLLEAWNEMGKDRSSQAYGLSFRQDNRIIRYKYNVKVEYGTRGTEVYSIRNDKIKIEVCRTLSQTPKVYTITTSTVYVRSEAIPKNPQTVGSPKSTMLH